MLLVAAGDPDHAVMLWRWQSSKVQANQPYDARIAHCRPLSPADMAVNQHIYCNEKCFYCLPVCLCGCS